MKPVEPCGRCGATTPDVRLSLVCVHREQRQDGHPIEGPEYDHTYRCAACLERLRRHRVMAASEQEAGR